MLDAVKVPGALQAGVVDAHTRKMSAIALSKVAKSALVLHLPTIP